MKLQWIAFDADDTLWHNESLYHASQDELRRILARFAAPEEVNRRLFATEMRNLDQFGYGIKAFTLSMIETAIEVSAGAIPAPAIQQIIDLAHAMIAHPVELLEGVEATLELLGQTHSLMLITKGDLLDQQRKINRSGLANCFSRCEILSAKTADEYSQLLERKDIQPERFLMVGNSLRSDVLPVIGLGGWGVHIPYPLAWEHEHAEPPPKGHPRLYELASISELPSLISTIEREH